MEIVAACELVAGVLVEPLGDQWVAFSPASGETHLLNDTSAAVLELLDDTAILHFDHACATLAHDTGMSATESEPLINDALRAFVTAGLVRVLPASQTQGNIAS